MDCFTGELDFLGRIGMRGSPCISSSAHSSWLGDICFIPASGQADLNAFPFGKCTVRCLVCLTFRFNACFLGGMFSNFVKVFVLYSLQVFATQLPPPHRN